MSRGLQVLYVFSTILLVTRCCVRACLLSLVSHVYCTCTLSRYVYLKMPLHMLFTRSRLGICLASMCVSSPSPSIAYSVYSLCLPVSRARRRAQSVIAPCAAPKAGSPPHPRGTASFQRSSQYPGGFACVPCTQLCSVSVVVYAIMQNPNTTRKISVAFCQKRVATAR